MRFRVNPSCIPGTFRAAAFGLAALMLSGAASAQGQEIPQGNPCFGVPVFAVITGVNTHGDLSLGPQDSRAKLADISLPEAGPWRQRAIDALRRLTGSEVAASLDTKPDRWGLYRAALTTEEGDLAARLVAEGLAVVHLGETQSFCSPHLLALEQKARDSRAGLWADDANRPISSDDTVTLLQRSGRFTLVYGRIASVGIRQKWVYLNFGYDWKQDFTATVSLAVWARMQEKGLTAEALTGKQVRLRGIIRQWNGPSMEVAAPDAVEITGKADRT